MLKNKYLLNYHDLKIALQFRLNFCVNLWKNNLNWYTDMLKL